VKRSGVVLFVVIILAVVGPDSAAQPLNGMSLNAATGLIGIPSGRIGWQTDADLGIDLGYHALFDNDEIAHIPKVSISLLRLTELSFAYDSNIGDDNEDMIFGAKIRLPIDAPTAVAIGANFQRLQLGEDNDENVQQFYLASTYPGSFFGMPAETTLVVGKAFGEMVDDGDIDFGMGFDLELFPNIFQGYIHWINDFANFSYSRDPAAGQAERRGAFNTGVRIDLAAHPALSDYKLLIDFMLVDALDDTRAFGAGVSFGAPLM